MRHAAELYWLPVAPHWRDDLRDADAGISPEDAWQRLVRLANARLDFLQTNTLDRILRRRFGNAPPTGVSAKPIRLAVLASSTAEHLLPGLRVGALRRGLWMETYVAGYGQYHQELVDSESSLHRFEPNVILFALDAGHVTGLGADAGESAGAEATERIIDKLEWLWRLGQRAFGAQVIQQTLLPIFPSIIGSNEHRFGLSRRWLVDATNFHLRHRASAAGVDLLSVDARVAEDGLAAWHDPSLWYRAKQEVHPTASPLYGDLVARLIAAQQGRSFKCLVLDLDNTLWGGVVGDDGVEGIVLGQGNAVGEAYLEFQHYVRAQTQRGVILAVCSKNGEKSALAPFERHPEMVLKRSDFAAFIANWDDKAGNLRRIAETLNIGIDSLAFVDDSPFERNLVRRELPMVAVPELPDDPAHYARCLADSGLFEALGVTEEDRARTQQYQANLKRSALRAATTDLAGYLKSLEMELRWKPFDKLGLHRIVQLINKTNQFNLTTRRYSAEAVTHLLDAPGTIGLQLRLLDTFGDNGIIAIVIASVVDHAATVDTWLMSCRVLGRQVEEATLNLLAVAASERGADRIIGEYRPSTKNEMVRDHYAKLGFSALDRDDGGRTRWQLPLERFTPLETFINIVRD